MARTLRAEPSGRGLRPLDGRRLGAGHPADSADNRHASKLAHRPPLIRGPLAAKKTMRWLALHLAAILSIPVICQASAVPSVPEYIAPSEQATLKAWLTAHPEYRVALDGDCHCASNIETIRKGSGGVWKANPNYHPYYVAGDFNGDNKTDFAVMLINTSEKGKHYLAIFNGPHKAGSKPPVSA